MKNGDGWWDGGCPQVFLLVCPQAYMNSPTACMVSKGRERKGMCRCREQGSPACQTQGENNLFCSLHSHHPGIANPTAMANPGIGTGGTLVYSGTDGSTRTDPSHPCCCSVP